MSKSMFDLFADQLEDLHGGVALLSNHLSAWAAAAHNADLKAAFEKRHNESYHQLQSLERIVNELNFAIDSRMAGSLRELVNMCDRFIREDYEPEVLDAGLLGVAQIIIHHQIAALGTLVTWAKKLGYPDHAHLLSQMLADQKRADADLTRLAESDVNHLATMGVRHE